MIKWGRGDDMKHTYFLEQPNFVIENINFENVARPKNFKYHHKCREKHAFIYTVSGTMENNIIGKEECKIYVEAGELIFIPKNCEYIGTYYEDNTEIKMIQFDIIGEDLPPYLSSPQKITLPKIAEQVDAFFAPLTASDMTHPFYHLSRLYELLWLIDINYSKVPSKFKKIKPALYELTEYYYENQKISYYATLCDMSEVNFRRLFHEYTGQSPIDYRNEIRLKNAKLKLTSGLYNVSEVAMSTGFSNLSFFTRLYKEKFGHTPKEEA